jgi:hypothetical protein
MAKLDADLTDADADVAKAKLDANEKEMTARL